MKWTLKGYSSLRSRAGANGEVERKRERGTGVWAIPQSPIFLARSRSPSPFLFTPAVQAWVIAVEEPLKFLLFPWDREDTKQMGNANKSSVTKVESGQPVGTNFWPYLWLDLI